MGRHLADMKLTVDGLHVVACVLFWRSDGGNGQAAGDVAAGVALLLWPVSTCGGPLRLVTTRCSSAVWPHSSASSG